MIESVLVDELRERLAEDVARGQFKTAPEPADERVEQILSSASRPVRGAPRRMGGMNIAKARQMEKDARDYDSKLAKGGDV